MISSHNTWRRIEEKLMKDDWKGSRRKRSWLNLCNIAVFPHRMWAQLRKHLRRTRVLGWDSILIPPEYKKIWLTIQPSAGWAQKNMCMYVYIYIYQQLKIFAQTQIFWSRTLLNFDNYNKLRCYYFYAIHITYSLIPLTEERLLCKPPALTSKNSAFCPWNILVGLVRSQQYAFIFPTHNNRLIPVMEPQFFKYGVTDFLNI